MTAQIGMVLVGARGFGRCNPNIARGTGLGQSAPLGRGLTNNARLAPLRPSSRSPSASTVLAPAEAAPSLARAT